MKNISFLFLFMLLSTNISAQSIDQKVAEWQLSHFKEFQGGNGKTPPSETDWVSASFYIGLARWAGITNQHRYLDIIRAMGERNNWQLGHLNWGPPIYYADNHAIGQVYIAAFDHFGDHRMIDPLVQRLEYILKNPPIISLEYDDERKCMARWCWSDALFMAPSTWFGIARIQKDNRFRNYANKEFWATTDFLFDKDEHLYYRDSRFIGKTGQHGEKIFWSRGNGWAIAGITNILRELNYNDPLREQYSNLLTKMAQRLTNLQRSDGFWSTSLLAHEQGVAEASGTGFITYAIAEGINMGILNREYFSNVVDRGYKALQSVITNGKLGLVQQIGEKPEQVELSNSQLYGTGAFLLSASVIKNAHTNR